MRKRTLVLGKKITYSHLSLSLTHHFVVDDDHDNGGEEECDPFDQIKRKKGKEESEV